MPRQNKAKPAPALAENWLRKTDQVGRQIEPENSTGAAPAQPLIDRFGHHHSAAVFENWSPAVLKALEVKYVESGEPAAGAS